MNTTTAQLAQYVDLVAEMALARHAMQQPDVERRRLAELHLANLHTWARAAWAELSR